MFIMNTEANLMQASSVSHTYLINHLNLILSFIAYLTENGFSTEEEYHAALQQELESGDDARVAAANSAADLALQLLSYENFAGYMQEYKRANPSDEPAE